MCVESHLRFITISNLYQMVGMFQVDFHIYPGRSQRVQQVGDQREGVSILLGDFVEGSIVDTQSEAAILFLDEKYRGAPWRSTRLDESILGVFI